MAPSHVRFISLALALSVVVGAWLLFEYSNQPAPQLVPSPSNDSYSAQPMPPSEASPLPISPQASPKNLNLTFKCEKNGRVSFGDKPCENKEKTVAVTTSEDSPQAGQKYNVQQKRQLADAMEAERLQRDRQFSNKVAVNPGYQVNTDQSKVLHCKSIDEEIVHCDFMLRQPHSAEQGDYWTGRRKKLTDERFSIRC